ncbi:hypothetical protein GY45DRAFT_289698 [Cubamyces sp. BRFM 1775]|nr:hypothetical protein GY45DRAFT_289698 [Cubamyces sp. BRFM 1775]
MSLTIEERLAIIKGLNVRHPRSPYALAVVTAAGDSAAVDAGSSIAFVVNLNDQMKADVLNSTLLAQLDADASFDRQKDTTGWYNSYKRTLVTLGWVVKDFQFTRLEDVHNFKSAEELILQYAATYLSKQEHDLFAVMLTALQQPTNRGAAKLLDNSARVLNQTNFQAGVASVVSGQPTFKIGAYTCTATWTLEHAVFFELRPQLDRGGTIQFYAESQTMTLDDKVYSQIRTAVLEKLGHNAQALVDAIML